MGMGGRRAKGAQITAPQNRSHAHAQQRLEGSTATACARLACVWAEKELSTGWLEKTALQNSLSSTLLQVVQSSKSHTHTLTH